MCCAASASHCQSLRALHFHQAQSSGICLPVIAERLACKPVGLPLQHMGLSATRPSSIAWAPPAPVPASFSQTSWVITCPMQAIATYWKRHSMIHWPDTLNSYRSMPAPLEPTCRARTFPMASYRSISCLARLLRASSSGPSASPRACSCRPRAARPKANWATLVRSRQSMQLVRSTPCCSWTACSCRGT